ncbi:MAG: FHA domain-containing protein [Acaryochloridaceae cyanobacterium SU_2_1]|nr:FHA domain-containing protein [Acaryochloridaceae cyanobacterium SU_2_1]
MSFPSKPQLFIPADTFLSHQILIESGFWTPSVSMVRSSSQSGQGYYRSLVGEPCWILGRSPDCAITFDDVTLSRQHALLFTTPIQELYFSDLGSLNGSFVNEQRVLHPICLSHGDQITLGNISMEFQISGAVNSRETASSQKLVLMVQPSGYQGKLWQEFLMSQGISVLWEQTASSQELGQFLRQFSSQESRLPDLVLADVAALVPNPYEFCRWCQQHYPALKVVLTCVGRTEILAAEQHWAQRQGAHDLLPGFRQDNVLHRALDIVSQVNAVLRLLDSPELEQNTMATGFMSLIRA